MAWRLLLCLALAWAQCHPAAARLWGGQAAGAAPFTPVAGDEFIGPLAGWYNVKLLASQTVAGLHGCPSNTSQAAIGNGVADDTTAIQNCLTDLGGSNAPVLWVPAGTYKITGQLTLSNRQLVSVLGEDPATTTIKWAGASTSKMLLISGVFNSRFNRLTFDGNGVAGMTGIDQSNLTSGFFDTSNEYADDYFTTLATAFRCGGGGANGCSEISITRDHFLNVTGQCVSTANFNAVDIWVRYSTFDHCATGVSNTANAGNFRVYNSNFFNSSVADMSVGTTGLFSIRNNYSIGSKVFFTSFAIGADANITLQGNTVFNTTDSASVVNGNKGPFVMYDNTICSLGGAAAPIVSLTDAIAIGNSFTVASPIDASIRIDEIGTAIGACPIPSTAPTLPGVEPNNHRQIFEVTAGSNAATIQAAINSAAALNGNRPVVHLQYGTYSISTALTVPANTDVQLVGDGYNNTVLIRSGGVASDPVIQLAGPSRATLRDFQANGNNAVEGIVATNIDQPGSHVFMYGVITDYSSWTNLSADNLDYTVIDAENFIHQYQTTAPGSIGVKVVGGALAAAGTPQTGAVNIYSGASAGEVLPYQVSAGGTLLARDIWYESSPSSQFFNVRGRGLVTFEGLEVASVTNGFLPAWSISDLVGKVTLSNVEQMDRIVADGNGSAANILASGIYSAYAPSGTYLLNNASPAATVGIVGSRELDSGGTPVQTTNSGTIDNTTVLAMYAQTRAATQQQITTLPAGVTDLRMYRVSATGGLNNIHLIGGATGSPFATLSATPGSVTTSESATLTWTSAGATSCAGTGFSTGGATSGTASVSPTSTTKYAVTCTGATGLTDYAPATIKFVSPGTEMAVNGDFESGTSPWSVSGGTTIVASDAHSPTHSVHVVPNSGNFQTITGLTPNTTYTVTCWAHVLTPGTLGDSSWCGVQSFGGVDQAKELTPAASYTQFTVPAFTTGPINTTAQIYGFSDTATTSIDDFSVHLQ